MKGRRFVQIFSGVGSGKNYFVERFLEGDEEHKIPKKIVDSSGYSYSESKFESTYTRRWIAGTSEEQIKGAANQELKRLCCEHGVQDELFNNRSTLDTIHSHKNLEEYVDFIHQKYPYVRYSYFDNMFKYYHIKNIGLMYQRKSIAMFNRIIENPDACIAEYQK